MVARDIVAAIGNFDGVHPGHRHLLKQTGNLAREVNADLGVVLFDPHPRRYFRPEDPPFLLTAPAHRDELLRAEGVEEIFSLPFDALLANLSPEDFVGGVLKQKLGLKGIVAGEDFHFGKNRAGDGEALMSLASQHGMAGKLVELRGETEDAEKYGSSAVRAAIKSGDMKLAARMLGREWAVSGAVEEGQKLGRTIGFATANLRLGDLIEPRRGVYATRTRIKGGTYHSVSNFGRRPTVGSDAPLLETHLFDFDGDLYGVEIEVIFIDFLRDEQKFDGLDALKAQIALDCEQARDILS